MTSTWKLVMQFLSAPVAPNSECNLSMPFPSDEIKERHGTLWHKPTIPATFTKSLSDPCFLLCSQTCVSRFISDNSALKFNLIQRRGKQGSRKFNVSAIRRQLSSMIFIFWRDKAFQPISRNISLRFKDYIIIWCSDLKTIDRFCLCLSIPLVRILQNAEVFKNEFDARVIAGPGLSVPRMVLLPLSSSRFAKFRDPTRQIKLREPWPYSITAKSSHAPTCQILPAILLSTTEHTFNVRTHPSVSRF